MAINKKIINFVKSAIFKDKYANNEILDTSIVFIDDTHEIHTHKTTFGGNISGDTITLGGSTYTVPTRNNETNIVGPVTTAAQVQFDLSWKELPLSVYDSILSADGTYLVQVTWGKAIYTGIFPYKELHENTTYNSDSECPVVTTDEEIVLTSCGYLPSDKARLYMKLAPGSRGTTETIANILKRMPTKPSLFIATSKSGQSLDNLTFKFRQLI